VIIVIDNYDSFTYNLVQYLGELGAELSVASEVQVYRNDQISLAEIRQLQPAAVVISPGPGRPEDAGISLELIKELGPTLPILGVCLGHQSIGQVFGGKIVSAARVDARQNFSGRTRRNRSFSGRRIADDCNSLSQFGN
jgi:anthranilate synthase component 2